MRGGGKEWVKLQHEQGERGREGEVVVRVAVQMMAEMCEEECGAHGGSWNGM